MKIDINAIYNYSFCKPIENEIDHGMIVCTFVCQSNARTSLSSVKKKTKNCHFDPCSSVIILKPKSTALIKFAIELEQKTLPYFFR